MRGAQVSAGRARPTGFLGLVVDAEPGARELVLEGRPLAAHAVDALRVVRGLDVRVLGPAAHGVPGLAVNRPWRDLAVDGLVLHDAHCPLLPGPALREAVQLRVAVGADAAVVGVRPVTDTIKQVVGGAVVGTVDRDALSALASPVVVGPALLDELARRLPAAGQLAHLADVLAALVECGRVVPHEVPSAGRRVADPDDVVLMECLHLLRRTLREH